MCSTTACDGTAAAGCAVAPGTAPSATSATSATSRGIRTARTRRIASKLTCASPATAQRRRSFVGGAEVRTHPTGSGSVNNAAPASNEPAAMAAAISVTVTAMAWLSLALPSLTPTITW